MFDLIKPKIQNILAMFPQILKLEKNVELIKNDGVDDELVDFENSFNEQLTKIKEVQGIPQDEPPAKSTAQIV